MKAIFLLPSLFLLLAQQGRPGVELVRPEEAMLAIFQKTGTAVEDPGTQLTFRRLDVKAALDHVFDKPKR